MYKSNIKTLLKQLYNITKRILGIIIFVLNPKRIYKFSKNSYNITKVFTLGIKKYIIEIIQIDNLKIVAKKLYNLSSAYIKSMFAHQGVVANHIETDMNKYLFSTVKHIKLGFVVFFIFICLAKIDSAVTAYGIFTPSSRKKIIQHLEGGIVEKIMIEEGDLVKQGQILVKLNEAASNAEYEAIRHNLYTKKIERLRVVAEIDNINNITPDAELEKMIQNDTKLTIFLQQEKNKLQNNISVIQERINVLNLKKIQNSEQIRGLIKQINFVTKRISVLEHDQQVLELLKKQKLADHDRLFAVQQEVLSLKGDLAERHALHERLMKNNNEIESEIDLTHELHTKELKDLLQEIDTALNQLQARLQISTDVFDRTSIRSPVDGIITMVNINGEGQVVNQNHDIMEIVPIDDDLIIEARVPPQSISIVNIGLTAKVMPIFPNQKITKPIYGKVIHVSHDAKIEPSREPYFIVKIKFKADELQRMYKQKILPGMYANVFISTGERRMIEYIFEPLFFSLLMSFNEV